MKRAEIDKALAQHMKGTTFVLFRGHYRELPVVALPLKGLLYRPENGRIITQLQARLKAQDIDPAAFSRAIDESWVQDELHALLLELARDERGPIYRELEQQAQQTEPLLITREGVVVNGNRRLAAMRDLHARDPERYAGFARVRAAVLPEETTAEDIEYVESALQLAPETKLAYTWTNRRLKLRRQRDVLNLPVKAILESYRLPDKKAIKQELAELALAEAYLAEYCEQPEVYDQIEDAEALFVGLQATLAEFKADQARALWRWAGFAMIHARREIGPKLLNYFPFAEAKPAWMPEEAMRRLAEQEGLIEEGAEGLPAAAGRKLVALLGDRDESVRLARQLVDILDQVRIDANWQQAPKKLLQHVQQARKLAESLVAERLTAKQKAQIGSELAAIQYHSRRFLEGQGDAPAPVSQTRRRWRKLRENPHRYCAESRHPALRAIARFMPGQRA